MPGAAETGYPSSKWHLGSSNTTRNWLVIFLSLGKRYYVFSSLSLHHSQWIFLRLRHWELQEKSAGISTPPSMLVTTRILTFLLEDPMFTTYLLNSYEGWSSGLNTQRFRPICGRKWTKLSTDTMLHSTPGVDHVHLTLHLLYTLEN